MFCHKTVGNADENSSDFTALLCTYSVTTGNVCERGENIETEKPVAMYRCKGTWCVKATRVSLLFTQTSQSHM